MVSCRYKDRGPNQNTANRMYIASYEYTVNGVKSENQSFQQASSLQGEFICITYRILKRCFRNMMLSRGIGKFYCILSRCLLHFVSWSYWGLKDKNKEWKQHYTILKEKARLKFFEMNLKAFSSAWRLRCISEKYFKPIFKAIYSYEAENMNGSSAP